MTDLLNQDTVKLFGKWEDVFGAVKKRYSDFSDAVADYDKADEDSKLSHKDDVIELYNVLTGEYNELAGDIAENFAKKIYELEAEQIELKKA